LIFYDSLFGLDFGFLIGIILRNSWKCRDRLLNLNKLQLRRLSRVRFLSWDI